MFKLDPLLYSLYMSCSTSFSNATDLIAEAQQIDVWCGCADCGSFETWAALPTGSPPVLYDPSRLMPDQSHLSE